MKENQKNLISVIIPVYNISKYLDSALQSITEQSYKNLEIILVDDGSTDGSKEVCDSWCQADSRIQCIHKKNQGVGIARNIGLAHSKGNFVFFMDGDDLLDHKMCSILLESLLKNNSDVSYCGFYNIFENKTETIVPEQKILRGTEIQYELVTSISFFTAIWNKLFRRSVLKDENGTFIQFSSDIYVGEDALWLSKVLKNVKTVSAVPRPLYYWRRRFDSATQGRTGIRTDAKFLTQLDAYRLMIPELEDPRAKRIICKKYLGLCRDCMIQAYNQNDKVLGNVLKKRVQEDMRMYPYRDPFFFKLQINLLMAPLSLLK